MDKDEQIKQLKEELEYYKKNSLMICGMSTEDDDGEEAEELGVKDGETFFNFLGSKYANSLNFPLL